MHSSALRTFQLVTGCFGREPTIEDVEYFVQASMQAELMHELGREALKKTSIAKYLQVVRTYFKAMRLRQMEELEDIYALIRPVVRTEDYRRVILSEKEVERLLEAARTPYDLAFAIGYCFCRRLSEVLMLKGSDVRDNSVTFNVLKKKETIRKDLPLELLPEEWRQRLLQFRGKKGYVIGLTARSIEYAFKRSLKEARIKKDACFHSLRHSIICHLLDRGVSARTIKDQLSFHENIEMIYRIYGRIPEEAEFRIPRISWIKAFEVGVGDVVK